MSNEIQPNEVLFIGHGNGVVCYYRTGIPAMQLGCDWIGVDGPPGRAQVAVAGQTWSVPDFERYKVIFLQLAKGREWREEVKRLQNRGIKVVYEIDDYIHGLDENHEAYEMFDAKRIADHEMVMEVCDAISCATDWLADQYEALAPTYVTRTGLDLKRYRVTKPERSKIHIGWAGSIGHEEAIKSWLPAVEQVMHEYPDTRFINIGQDYVEDLEQKFPSRVLRIPFTSMENFPAALCNMDIGLAPASDNLFFAGKSDLRLLEYGVVGIPGIYNLRLYQSAIDAEQAVVTDSDDIYPILSSWVESEQTRKYVGDIAKLYVWAHRSIELTQNDWIDVIESVT